MPATLLAELPVTRPIALHIEELEAGIFQVFRHTPGDIEVVRPSMERGAFRIVRCEHCIDPSDSHGFYWHDVYYDGLQNRFEAPSGERLIEALGYLKLHTLE